MNKPAGIYNFISVYILLITGYTFYGQTFGFGHFSIDYFTNWKYLLNVIPTVFGLIAAAIFLISRFTVSRPIQIYCCYIIFNLPFFLISISGRFQYRELSGQYNSGFIMLMILLGLLLNVCCFAGLWLLNRNNKPLLKLTELGGETFSEFEPVTVSVRFVNRLIDVIIIMIVLVTNIFQNPFFRENFRGTGRFELYLVEMAAGFCYYMLLEGIFNITIGKCITNTIVVNDEGEKPSFINMTGRTLCRLIPFDALSFLGSGSRGWHDSMSGTYVVRKNDE